MHHPHHQKHVPSFCKQYADLGQQIDHALLAYKHEVQQGIFPDTAKFSPYKMSDEEQNKLQVLLDGDAKKRSEEAVKHEKKLRESDEYEIIKLY